MLNKYVSVPGLRLLLRVSYQSPEKGKAMANGKAENADGGEVGKAF